MQVSRNTNTPEPELGGVSARREETYAACSAGTR